MSLFGSPNIQQLQAKNDVRGLIKALGYQKDAPIREQAAAALGQIKDAQAVQGFD
ncbi:MAG: hypothetical protein HC837_19825 [Chloroflexaceae bacterium]|nr:hypothetical protein [Chloroflexaceae bacterium]